MILHHQLSEGPFRELPLRQTFRVCRRPAGATGPELLSLSKAHSTSSTCSRDPAPILFPHINQAKPMLVLNGNLSETSQPVSSHCSQSVWFQSSYFSSYFPVAHFFLSARLHCSGHWSFSSCRMSKAGPICPLPSPEDTGNPKFSGQLLLLFPQFLSYHSPLKTQGLFWTQWLSLHQ